MKKVTKILLLAVMSGCGRCEHLDPTEYMSYIESTSNGFRHEVKAGKVSYTIQLATPEYMSCKELASTKGYNVRQLKERLDELRGNIFFLINIAEDKRDKKTTDNIIEKMHAGERTQYYEVEQQENIALQVDGQILKPEVYQYEDNYGLVDYNTIVVGFKVDSMARDMNLVFNDRYHDNPLIRSGYSKQEISQIPCLAIK